MAISSLGLIRAILSCALIAWLLAGCSHWAPLPDQHSASSASGAAEEMSLPPSRQASSSPVRPSVTGSTPLPLVAVGDTPPPPLIDLTQPPEDLWVRIRRGFSMPDLHDPLVAERQSWYLNRPAMLRRIFERGRRYLFHIVEEIEKRGLPTELALLPMVESAFNPHAVSPAKAMGLWQFIPSTGKIYNLDQNWWVDERRDIIASTDAALTYLQRIYEMHGDWHLALASYNWGEGAVGRAIAKNQAKGLPTDYTSLTLPAETRHYVPKLQALKNIIAQPELFGIHLPPLPNQPYFETVMRPERIDIVTAAQLAEIPLEEFVSLNPAYQRPLIQGEAAGGELLLPADKVGTFLANLARYTAEEKPLTNWQTYLMKKGDTLAKVAQRFQLSEARLRQINGIGPRVKVGPGFNLLVPRPGSAAAERIAHLLPPPPAEPARVEAVTQVRAQKASAAVQRAGASKSTARAKTVTERAQAVKRVKPAATQGKPAVRAAPKAVPRASAKPATRSSAAAPAPRPKAQPGK